MDENNVVSVLEHLIETCRDGQKGYHDAAQHVKRPDLKAYFDEQALERARFAAELQTELAKAGKPDKKPSGSASGAIRRAWIDAKVAMGGGDKTILDSIEKGEDEARDTYQKALSGSLTPQIAEIVRRQATSVQRAHDKTKMLRDAVKAA